MRSLHSLGCVCAVILVWPTAGAIAQGNNSPLLLRDAIVTALERNPAVHISEDDIDLKQGLFQEASGQFDWNVTASGNVAQVRTPTVDAFGNPIVDETAQSGYSFGLSKEFRDGIIIEPNAVVTVPESRSPFYPAYGTSQINLQIIVPLLRGAGKDSADAAEAAARGNVETARLTYEATLATQALSTATAYWNCRAAAETLAIQKEEEERAQKLYNSVKVLVRSQVFPPDLAVQAQANVLEKSTERINAELSANSARVALGAALGYGPERIVQTPWPTEEFPPLPASVAPYSDEEKSDLVKRALRQRTDYLAALQNEVGLRILQRQAEVDLKPQLNLSLSGGYAGYDPSNNLVRPLVNRVNGGTGQIGFNFAWPVINDYQRGLLRQDRATLREAQGNSAESAITVSSDVLTALESVRLNADSVRSAQSTVDIALKAEDQANARLKTGDVTVLDVINLENLTAEAQSSLIASRAGYATAVAQLRYALGEIFANPKPDHSFQLLDLTVPPLQ